jgi:mRNA-degrading endonuclease toxin of MazEF toxin-antitoxin module
MRARWRGMLRTFFAPKSISNKCSTVVAPITSNTATVGESGVLFQIDGRDSVVLLDRVTTIEKGRLGKSFGKLGDEKALAVVTPSMGTFIPENFTP